MFLTLEPNDWESRFFNRAIANVKWCDEETAFSFEQFELICAKIKTGELDKKSFLEQCHFKFICEETDFCLHLQNIHFCTGSPYQIATSEDINALKSLFSASFPFTRFCEPFYSLSENRHFYAQWIENAVEGKFDDLCLIEKDHQKIKGGISLRIRNKEARIGLLAVDKNYQKQGIAKHLLYQAIHYAKSQGVEVLWIATQSHNIAAINLYKSLGAKIQYEYSWYYLVNKEK